MQRLIPHCTKALGVAISLAFQAGGADADAIMVKSKDDGDRMRAGGRPCPLCGKPVNAAHRPFCSRRCAEIDLGRWLGGAYVIPGPELGADDDPDD